MLNKAISQIEFEIEQIDNLLESYCELLIQVQSEAPDLIELTALASVLHSFYNGLENIFLTIAKKIDVVVPVSNRWHADLLTQMTKKSSFRKQVLTIDISDQLTDYLGFRHFYRHSYSFVLEWDELSRLVLSLNDTWNKTKKEILLFLDSPG